MNEIVRFGIVGTNTISHIFMAGAFQLKDFALTAIYSRKEETGRTFGDKYGVCNIFTDLKELAKSDLIDAIYIASPNAFHCNQAMMFLNHGKHVLCEKAFASNSREAEKMIKTARANNVLIMEAMRSTVVPNFLVIKENLHKIGTIRRVFLSKCQYSSRYDSYKAGTVMNAFKREMSNGALMDIGVYCVHPIVELFGRPKDIIASSQFLDSGVDAQGTVILKYENMDALMLYSKVSNSYLPCEIQGENGTLTSSDINDFTNVTIRYRDGSEEVISRPQEMDNICYEIDEFIKLVQRGKIESQLNSHERTLVALQVMDGIRRQVELFFPADEEQL